MEQKKGIENFTTKELVEELSKRVGVNRIEVPPYETKIITIEGPSIILDVID